MNHHDIVSAVKKIIYSKGEKYQFNNKSLLFAPGTRPIKRKYLNSENDVVRNDVLQINYFEQHFKADHVLWDIGSHHGHYSIFAAVIAKGNNQVFSFEPDSVARNIQIRNFQLNQLESKIVVSDIAVSDRNGTLHFHSLEGNSNSHIIKDDNFSDRHTIEVQTKTVNTLVSELPLPNFVKIDTEGAEIDILRGAGSLLEKPDITFICELHPFAWESFNVSYDDFLSILNKYGRKIQLLDTAKKIDQLPFYGTVIF
jgi:FkbM family methyltransferase